MKKAVSTSALLALALLFTGFGEKPNSTSETKEKALDKPPEPVTLKFYTKSPIDDFEKYINQHVKKKFPHVTLQVVENKKGSDSGDTAGTGQIYIDTNTPTINS
ncbi:hypothetical protein [Paenibacillus ginsengarvi]|nr:hypothetical protein [Paenibacillus ginsengarvi]